MWQMGWSVMVHIRYFMSQYKVFLLTPQLTVMNPWKMGHVINGLQHFRRSASLNKYRSVCGLVFLTDNMIVFDNHLLAATPEVEISVISWNTTLIKDGKIFCVSQHIIQRPLMQEQCDSCIRIPG